MKNLKNYLLFFLAIFSFTAFIRAVHQCKNKKNPFGLTPLYSILGAFVWGDVVVFGLFWFFVAVFILILKDWLLFLLIISVFWLIRSNGEMIYWLNEQFSEKTRNEPHKLFLSSVFPYDSIWYVYQIGSQCISVISLISTIYITKLWLETISL